MAVEWSGVEWPGGVGRSQKVIGAGRAVVCGRGGVGGVAECVRVRVALCWRFTIAAWRGGWASVG